MEKEPELKRVSKEYRKDSITLRTKLLKSGRKSLYLDIYINGKREYKFLSIHLSGNKAMTDLDRENLRMAKEIRAQFEVDLTVKKYRLEDLTKLEQDFIAFAVSKAKNAGRKKMLWHLKAFSKGKPIPFGSLTAQYILAFQNFLCERVKQNSVRTYMAHLKGTLTDAVREGLLSFNPYLNIEREQRIKPQETNTPFVTISELQSMYKVQVHPVVKYLFTLCCFTGFRWSDAIRFSIDDMVMVPIETAPGEIQMVKARQFRQKKTQKLVIIPLNAMAIELMDQIIAYNKQQGYNGKYIFPTLYQPHFDRLTLRNNYGWILRSIKKWGKDAGINKDLRPHVGRHTFGALTYGLTRDLYVTAAMLGQTGGISNAMRYSHLQDSVKLEAAMKIPQVNLGQPID